MQVSMWEKKRLTEPQRKDLTQIALNTHRSSSEARLHFRSFFHQLSKLIAICYPAGIQSFGERMTVFFLCTNYIANWTWLMKIYFATQEGNTTEFIIRTQEYNKHFWLCLYFIIWFSRTLCKFLGMFCWFVIQIICSPCIHVTSSMTSEAFTSG